MKKKILLLGTCRVLPEHKYISSNAGFFYETDHDHDFEYHARPYGQCVSLQQLHSELHHNYHEPTYHNKNLNSYIKSLDAEKGMINRDRIDDEQHLFPYNQYDGYVFEISSFKYSKRDKIILAPDIATTPDNIDENQKIYKNDNTEEFFTFLEEINVLLNGKPILFILPYTSIVPERYKLHELLLTFCKKHSHICSFDPNNIIFSLGYKKTFVKLPKKKSRLKQKIHNREIIQKNIPYINPIDETVYDTTHFSDSYREELIKYYKYFFDLFSHRNLNDQCLEIIKEPIKNEIITEPIKNEIIYMETTNDKENNIEDEIIVKK